MSLQAYLAFVAACIALALLPGPVVTLVIANGLRHGTRAALINFAGAQAGLDDRDRHRRDRPDLADGDHGLLVRLGALCRRGLSDLARDQADSFAGRRRQCRRAAPPPRGGFFLQGFLVLLSNPKVLVFFGAFIPQFMDMSKDHFPQVALLGITFMVIAASPTRSMRCSPAARGCSSRSSGRGCCRASPAAS